MTIESTPETTDARSKAAIDVQQLHKSFGDNEVLKGIDFHVDQGQVEAARSLGMSRGRAMITIVIPQAFRIILPPLTNELIMLTKDSSLIYIVGVTREQYELTKFGREFLSRSPTLTPILVIGLSYLVITLPLGYLSRYLERRSGGKKVSVV